jgi:hypothetical protein
MLYVVGKTVAPVFLIAVILTSVLSVTGQVKLLKLPKSENLEIAPVEVIQVLEQPVNLSDAVLAKTDKGYVLKYTISNNLATPIIGLDYMLLVIDSNNSREAILSVSEKLKLKGHDTNNLVSKTSFGLTVTQGYRLFLISNRVFDGESIWEVPKAVNVLEAFASGDYSVTPRATRITNLVDTPISGGKIIF